MKPTNLIAFLLAAMIAVSCNPVKQIMKDQAKFNLIKEEVIRQGFCANDTTIITASDTLIQYDTTVQKETEIVTIGDTVYVTKWQTRDIIKKLTIRDTIKSVVVDNARFKVLESDNYKLKLTADEWKQKAQNRLSYLILCIVAIGLWLFFKFKP